MQLMSGSEDAGMDKECVEYMIEQMKLLKTQIASQKLEKEVGVAETAL